MALIILPPLTTSVTVVWRHITPKVTSDQTPCYSSFERVLTPPITTHYPCQLQHTLLAPFFPNLGTQISQSHQYWCLSWLSTSCRLPHIMNSSLSLLHYHHKPGESITMMPTSCFAPGQYCCQLSKQLGHTAATLTNTSTDNISKHCRHIYHVPRYPANTAAQLILLQHTHHGCISPACRDLILPCYHIIGSM